MVCRLVWLESSSLVGQNEGPLKRYESTEEGGGVGDYVGNKLQPASRGRCNCPYYSCTIIICVTLHSKPTHKH